MKKMFLLSALLLICASTTIAQKSKGEIIKNLDAQTQKYGDIALEIWDLAEMGYLEEKSSALLQETLANEGFSIKKGIAGIPTAFVAEYGSGYPVIAILGEYDALPGLSQEAVPEKKTAGKAAGHACGHHLSGRRRGFRESVYGA